MIDPIEQARQEMRMAQGMMNMNAPVSEYERVEPEHDYLLVRLASAEMLKSRGGMFMPVVEDPTGNQRASGWYEVIAVGPGPWTDRVDANGQFLRRPMCCSEGDLVIFQGKPFPFTVPGVGACDCIQNYQVCAVQRRKA